MSDDSIEIETSDDSIEIVNIDNIDNNSSNSIKEESLEIDMSNINDLIEMDMNEDEDDKYLLDLEYQEITDKEYGELLKKLSKRGVKYIRVSSYLKHLNRFYVMFLIVGSCLMSVYSAVVSQDYISAVVLGILGAAQFFYDAFGIGKNGIYYRYAGLRLQKLGRKLKKNYNNPNLRPLLDDIEDEMDEIEITMFSRTYGPSKADVSSGEGELKLEQDDEIGEKLSKKL